MRRIATLGVVALAGMQLTCNQAILTAPAGSTITLIANPDFIPAHGGVAVISALVIDATGNPVGDGTVVQFFTTLGQIEEQGKTNDGVARVNLVSDARSGKAEVKAFSGGGSTGSTSGASATTSSSVTVLIGNTAASKILLEANPVRIVAPYRSSDLFANVFDDRGNPLANVPVFFRVEPDPGPFDFDTLGWETLDVPTGPVFTDNSGRAHNVLRTIAPFGGPRRKVIVFARVPTITDEPKIEIFIN